MPHPIYHLRFAFSHSTGTCFWPENDAARERYDYPIQPDELPLTPTTIAALNDLAARYDTSLNWNDPGGPLLWTDAQWDALYADARCMARHVREELGLSSYQWRARWRCNGNEAVDWHHYRCCADRSRRIYHHYSEHHYCAL